LLQSKKVQTTFPKYLLFQLSHKRPDRSRRFTHGENQNYIKFRRRQNIANFRNLATIADKTDFTRDGTYMDPMNDILSLYNTVDGESNLDLYFTYAFKRRKSLPEYTRQFFQRARKSKKRNLMTISAMSQLNLRKQGKQTWISLSIQNHEQGSLHGRKHQSKHKISIFSLVSNGK